MTARQRALLHLLVERYIQTQAPVPSARLAEALGLSPALARYELIALEEEGLVQKPHASAGRIPTRKGYQQYALSLLPPSPLPRETVAPLARAMEGSREPELLLVKVASRLSGYPALLRLRPRRAPRVLEVHLSHLEGPAGREVLAVAVLEGGRVREVRLPLEVLPERLAQAEALLRRFRLEEMPEPPAGLEELFARLKRALSQEERLEYREGLGLVLSEPEAEDPAFVKEVVAAFEGESEEVLTPPGRVNLRIGERAGISMVQAGLMGGEYLGELTLLGPLRMRYQEALAVAYSLGQVYTQVYAG
ncbi:HrcA family transcriptional regulator [Thermus filiformis]|uniref:Heat-inducible transcription repressor HrcA n=1 Tax=Thermus filiformis TaxID=276 RepID=A0A0A2WP18_THEFI|nr:HrcA family transcriptional regulator [Thermus filiformis]KGQ21926.2 HrcA family transcriptional regulator [Thermus filiformis]